MLTVNKLFLSGSFITTIDEIHNFSAGLQIGYVVKSFSLDGLTVPSQFNNTTGIFDSELPNNINTWDENINYPDFNIGVVYKGKLDKFNPFGGFSLFHVNNPGASK